MNEQMIAQPEQSSPKPEVLWTIFVDNLVEISKIRYVKCKNKGVYLRGEKWFVCQKKCVLSIS